MRKESILFVVGFVLLLLSTNLSFGQRLSPELKANVFPNPSSSDFLVQTYDDHSNISVYDMLGELIEEYKLNSGTFEKRTWINSTKGDVSASWRMRVPSVHADIQ